MAILRMKDIKKIYKMDKEIVPALQGVSFDVDEGEFISILGKSGSGKSTLLNVMAGLSPPTEGEIFLMDQPVHKMKETAITLLRKKYVGFIFQSYNLLTSHTALENVMLPLTFANIPMKERKERASAMLEAVGLSDRMAHLPKQMSGGQQQRVSIARAFVNEPRLVFADEPTGNLDSKTSDEIMTLMLSMIERYNQTFIMVTHDDETSDYANRIVRMQDGRIERIDQNVNRQKDRMMEDSL